jgi:hypothetical protein
MRVEAFRLNRDTGGIGRQADGRRKRVGARSPKRRLG